MMNSALWGDCPVMLEGGQRKPQTHRNDQTQNTNQISPNAGRTSQIQNYMKSRNTKHQTESTNTLLRQITKHLKTPHKSQNRNHQILNTAKSPNTSTDHQTLKNTNYLRNPATNTINTNSTKYNYN